MKITDFIRIEDRDSLRLEEATLSDGNLLPLLKFPLLEETGMVNHCFSTRMGGGSQAHLSSLNLSFTRGDNPKAVSINFSRVAEALGTTADHIVCSHQTHTTNVIRVGKAEMGIGVTRERPYTDVDGLITNEAGVVLSTSYADCVPLYFLDPAHKAIGLSHSGWRGTVNRMGVVTLARMKEEFGTNPADVICCIGPSICQNCYEISEDVAQEFISAFPGKKDQILIDKGNGKYQLDLWKSNEILLLEAGITPDHLAITNICTCCNPKLLFSHRASKGMRGNLGAFLSLKM